MDMKEIMTLVAKNHGQSLKELVSEIESLYQTDGQNADITADRFLKALTARILMQGGQRAQFPVDSQIASQGNGKSVLPKCPYEDTAL